MSLQPYSQVLLLLLVEPNVTKTIHISRQIWCRFTRYCIRVIDADQIRTILAHVHQYVIPSGPNFPMTQIFGLAIISQLGIV